MYIQVHLEAPKLYLSTVSMDHVFYYTSFDDVDNGVAVVHIMYMYMYMYNYDTHFKLHVFISTCKYSCTCSTEQGT